MYKPHEEYPIDDFKTKKKGACPKCRGVGFLNDKTNRVITCSCQSIIRGRSKNILTVAAAKLVKEHNKEIGEGAWYTRKPMKLRKHSSH